MGNVFANCGHWFKQLTEAMYSVVALMLETSIADFIHILFPNVSLPDWASSPLIFFLLGSGLITVLILALFKFLKGVVI